MATGVLIQTTLSVPSMEAFKQLVMYTSSTILPASFHTATTVVVASILGGESIANVFAASKVKGGTRLGS
eukprot:jgi/Tetstr1/464263/TSEL_009066.t1